MSSGINENIEKIMSRYDELGERQLSPDVLTNPSLLTKIAKERSDLEPKVKVFAHYRKLTGQLNDARNLMNEEHDHDMIKLVREEIEELEEKIEKLEDEIRFMLLPRDPLDGKDIVMEIRAGTGGEEASLFAAELYRMYTHYSDHKGWKIEVLSSSPSETGGFKEIIFSISGNDVYSHLKYESGVHRVQRVPVTESSGRIHTSAASVVVMPEAENIQIDLNPNDLKIDVYRSTGPGGQSVNTTDSAVRITHIPTGIVVSCQDEKSQLKNKTKALKVLRARLFDKAYHEQQDSRSAARKSMVGTGDRSEKIKTYNFPQNRVTDHRINLTVYRLDAVLSGELGELIEAVQLNAQKRALEGQARAIAARNG